MHLKAGTSAFVTGGGSGIGKYLCLELAAKGCSVTVADRNIKSADNVAAQVTSQGGKAQAVEVDIRDKAAQQRAFAQHLEQFSSLEIVCLNAGVFERGNILSEEQEGQWEQTLDINLKAQMVGARVAALAMQKCGSKGVILFTASGAGLFAVPETPVYAAAKAGLVNFARSLAPRLAERGIRVCTVCPIYVDTPMISFANAERFMPKKFAGVRITTAQVVKVMMYLIEDDSLVGTVLFIDPSGHAYHHTHSSSSLRRASLTPRGVLPESKDASSGLSLQSKM